MGNCCKLARRCYAGALDAARFNWGDNTVTVSTAVPTVDRVQAGVDEPGTLHILAGGVVSSGTWTGAGVAGNCIGTINVDAGGTLNTGVITPGGGHLWVAMNDGGAPYGQNRGVMNISGTVNVAGMIGIGTLNAVTPSGGVGTVTVLSGGVLNLGNIHGLGTSIQPGSVLDIRTGSASGLVTLPGDFYDVILAYVAAGRITGNGSGSNVVVEYTGTQTLVTAIPEPITLSLLGLGALLLRRRS